jgi:hypothetical protein
MSGVGAQGDPCTATIFWSTVSSPYTLFRLSQTIVSYIKESHHSRLVPHILPKRRYLNLAKATRSQRMCEAVYVAM